MVFVSSKQSWPIRTSLVCLLIISLKPIWLVREIRKIKILCWIWWTDQNSKVSRIIFETFILKKCKYISDFLTIIKNQLNLKIDFRFTKELNVKYFCQLFVAFLENVNCTKNIIVTSENIWTHYDIICINAIYLVNNDQKIISKVRGAFLWFIGGSFLATRRWWWPPMHSVRFF